MEEGDVLVLERKDMFQVLICGDIEQDDTYQEFLSVLPEKVDIVYSDPPWNPGNATYWRTQAGKQPCKSYTLFLDRFCSYVSACIDRGAMDIFTEQSYNDKHRNMFIRAVKRANWGLPLIEEWSVYYGSPGSRSVQHPNTLLHFGTDKLSTNPEGLIGEVMTIRVCAGLRDRYRNGSCIVDPCIGKGMTSRMAVYFQWNCIGIEINPKRLEKTAEWLIRRGRFEITRRWNYKK
ncbi:MAG: hypothetical protein DRN81_03395 [Thermoproteota archaeon]|nr:MAG: hypothetical protein DRN81_03395 [Candidatus Korarchaeota archaeon]